MRKTAIVAAVAGLLGTLSVPSPGLAARQAAPDLDVFDIFYRDVTTYGVQLVDWQGYLANPYIELTVRAPKVPGIAYPLTVDLKAEGTSRLMFNMPSELTATGATKSFTLTGPADREVVRLSIHSKQGAGQDELHKWVMRTTDATGATVTQTMPIRVQQDEKKKLEPTIPIDFDYRYDTITKYFSDPGVRRAAETAVRDWFAFFDLKPFDTVPAGDEVTRLPGDDWQNEVEASNAKPYNGMYVFFRGIQTPYSTGFPTINGKFHTLDGKPTPYHRSTSMILEYDEQLMKLFTALGDEDWYKTDLGSVIDVQGLVMHEYGHAVAFHSDWEGMAKYVESKGRDDQDVIDYQGYPVPLDSSYHVPGDDPYWDRISGQSGGWRHVFPTRRWELTKLSLLIAENAGWKLNRKLTPFLKPSIETGSLGRASAGEPYRQRLAAKGGVPFYDWQVTAGELPEGVTLDRFTGVLAGTPAKAGAYTFTVQLRDYDKLSAPVTKEYKLTVG
ncbi:Ig domain-containing protein [Nonomuraea rhodomycinica]|uniref:Putative Ig domain-containing protein n=1 Tax=Nonomuraea rhodomycinica TaxID=1712872 RepID=A0A7Y6ITJ7_9ACTN|nr:Ig domain-containing protein [Nonomuraea rhodomycinica]NUW44137.1 putative Ig domain-containing protein [Nonomuraea rhodomycinica]